MKIGEPYRFEDVRHFAGWVNFDDTSISILELEVQRIRNAYNIVKKREG